MFERRVESRLLCADLVEIEWTEPGPGGIERTVRQEANLEDISLSGACIQVEKEVPLNVITRIRHSQGELTGIVQYCAYRDIGYFLGIRFDPGSKWSPRAFRPLHLLDPRRLLKRTLERIDRNNAA